MRQDWFRKISRCMEGRYFISMCFIILHLNNSFCSPCIWAVRCRGSATFGCPSVLLHPCKNISNRVGTTSLLLDEISCPIRAARARYIWNTVYFQKCISLNSSPFGIIPMDLSVLDNLCNDECIWRDLHLMKIGWSAASVMTWSWSQCQGGGCRRSRPGFGSGSRDRTWTAGPRSMTWAKKCMTGKKEYVCVCVCGCVCVWQRFYSY